MDTEQVREELVELVEKNLPRFSGEKKVFVISLHSEGRFIKVIFWRPKNYTLVAYNHGALIGADREEFTVAAYHDSCWRYDGFSFLNNYTKNLKILSKLLDSRTCILDFSEKIFVILKNYS